MSTVIYRHKTDPSIPNIEMITSAFGADQKLVGHVGSPQRLIYTLAVLPPARSFHELVELLHDYEEVV